TEDSASISSGGPTTTNGSIPWQEPSQLRAASWLATAQIGSCLPSVEKRCSISRRVATNSPLSEKLMQRDQRFFEKKHARLIVDVVVDVVELASTTATYLFGSGYAGLGSSLPSCRKTKGHQLER